MNNLSTNPGTAKVRSSSSKAWLGVLLALATALRLFRLGTKSLWLDEAISVVLAQANRQTFVSALIHRQGNMALYYFFLRGWSRLGNAEFAVRSLSVGFGVAAIPAVYMLGKNLFGPKVGRVAALLLSVHVFHIRYSQEARAYSLLMLLAVLSSLFFLLSLERPVLKNWAAYVVASSLMVYAQVFGGWVLLSQWASLLLRRRETPWRSFLGSAAAICIFITPLAYCLLLVSDRSQLYWLTKPSLASLYRFGLDLTGDGGPLLLLAYLALVLGAVAVGVRLWRSQPAPVDAWKYGFLLIWGLLPVALVFIISLRWPMFVSRFLIFCLPPVVLLAADALTQIRSRVLFSAAVMLVLGLSVNGTYFYYRGRADAEHTDDWRDATRYILSQAEPGDALLFSYSEEKLVFDEYLRQLQVTGSPLRLFPEGTDLELLTRRPSRPSNELMAEIVGGYKRVCVISAFQPNSASRRVDALLAAHFRQHTYRNFGFVHADIYGDRTLSAPDQLGDVR